MQQTWHGPLERVDDYRWRLPASYQSGMRVPGLVFADEKLLKDIARDQALQQVANVAHLPGIVGHSLAMPDIHWGYGFPIGGVAATDPEAGGVVSPGGVGFDINCLSGDTQVLHRFGYVRTIADVVEHQLPEAVQCYESKPPQSTSAAISAGLAKRPTTRVLDVTTSNGRHITATADHPFLTPSGMRLLGTLEADDRVAVDPFEGVTYEEPSDRIIIDEEHVREFLKERGKVNGNTVPQVLGALRPLLPLRQNTPVFAVLTKVLGFIMGDGTLYFQDGTGKGIVWCFGRAVDLETIRKDLSPWFTCSRIYTRQRSHCIQTDYGEVRFEASNDCFRVSSTSFALLLALLGCPIGNRSLQDYELPKWLWEAPRWHQRLFLAAYFGAELQSPRAYAERNRNFPCPLLTVQKQEAYITSGRRFLEGIARLAQGFGVTTRGIEQTRERTVRTHGVSCRLRLLFSSKPDSLLALYTRIGFEYHHAKRAEAAVVAAYHLHKQVAWRSRRESIERILALRVREGLGATRIRERLLVGAPLVAGVVNQRFIERTLYGGSDRIVRVPDRFVSYREFHKNVTAGLEGSGLVWDRIERVTPRPDVQRVYDITVDHPDHNFVANGFVVHNCGVRLMRTTLTAEEVRPQLRRLVQTLFNTIPCGVGMSGDIRVGREEHRHVMTAGSRWMVEQKGYGVPEDLEHTESRGALDDADPSKVSPRAYQRGSDQLGTLGSGNHFLEVQVVETIFDEAAAAVFGLAVGQVTVMMHSGSRGFGYQVCDDYLDVVERAMPTYGIQMPDRQLACVPVNSDEGQSYLGAMRCAANYAWANRQCLMHLARQAFAQVFERSWQELGMALIYDVAHNIAKLERHNTNGRETVVLVHRKGATRAFPPGHPEIPAAYRSVGQPVIIPGDMGRNSYLLVGAPGAMEETFGTVCHGAGRMMSRTQAVREAAGRSIEKELESCGVIVMGRGRKGIAEEQPKAYKDVNDVVHVVHSAGIARKVVRMKPMGVIKG